MSDQDHGHGPEHYIKIYFVLLGLFAVSVTGPFVAGFLPEGNSRLYMVLITAFGVAVVKAYLVCAKFMHLEIERPIIHWLLGTALVFMVLLFAGAAPDVMNNTGTNWVKSATIEWHQTSANYRAKHGDDGHGDETSGHDEDPGHGDSGGH